MIGIPIASGLTMIVCFTLFYYYWRIRQLRARLLSVQAAPAHDVDFPVEFGIGKNVVETFPTIKACELKCTASEDLQCPICLVEYDEWEVLRQLPFCGHIFHTLCVGAWFEKQTTCPVCRMSMSELTESFGDSVGGIEDILYRGPRSSDAAVEVVTETPSWVMINRCLPLPAPPIPETSGYNITCTCSSGNDLHGHGTEKTTQPKTSCCEHVQLDAIQRRATAGSTADFHVVNIPQAERVSSQCPKCKCTAKPANKTVTSGDSLYSTATHQHSDVQILIFQAAVLARAEEGSDHVGLDVVSNNPQETTSGSDELVATQPILEADEGAVSTSRCDSSDSRDSSPNSHGEAQAPPEDVQTLLDSPKGSFEFQPILTETGELTFRATTL